MAQVADLVGAWIAQEKGVTFNGRLSRPSPREYMGGIGEGGSIPVLFPVTAEDGGREGLRGKSSPAAGGVLDPLELVRTMGAAARTEGLDEVRVPGGGGGGASGRLTEARVKV